MTDVGFFPVLYSARHSYIYPNTILMREAAINILLRRCPKELYPRYENRVLLDSDNNFLEAVDNGYIGIN